MASKKDATEAIRKQAASYPDVATGTSCNQNSFKVGKSSFLFIGPGAKGIGHKAMFKLDQSIDQARQLASQQPDRFEVGKTGWVTARFSDEKPLPKKVWHPWLQESYNLSCGSAKPSKVANKASSKTATKKKTTKKKSVAAKKKSPRSGAKSKRS